MLHFSNCQSAPNRPSDFAARFRDPASPRHVSCDIDAQLAQPRVMNPAHFSGSSLSVGEDDASTLNSTPRSDVFSSDDRSTSASTNMASDVDRHLHDVGVAALAAVSQFPHAVNDHTGSFLVSEVVNAVTSAGSPPDFRLLDSGGSFLSGRAFYPAPSVSHTPAGPDSGFGHGSPPGGDVNMEETVQDLTQHNAGRQNIAITHDSDIQSQKNMFMNYESTTMEASPSPSESDDELEDFIRFYPDEEEYYNLRKQRPTHDVEMADFDLDDFYNTINYEDIDVDLPQSLGGSIPDLIENHVAEQMEPEPHPAASIIHTSSKTHTIIWYDFANLL
jgi:hypothetical protein